MKLWKNFSCSSGVHARTRLKLDVRIQVNFLFYEYVQSGDRLIGPLLSWCMTSLVKNRCLSGSFLQFSIFSHMLLLIFTLHVWSIETKCINICAYKRLYDRHRLHCLQSHASSILISLSVFIHEELHGTLKMAARRAHDVSIILIPEQKRF